MSRPPVQQLRDALVVMADPERAIAMRAYMKGHFPFLGVAAPERRLAQKTWIAGWKGADAHEVIAVARALWAEEERELHYVAADLLQRHAKALGARHLPDLRHLITHHSWWDTVDHLASHPVGAVVRREDAASVMDRWVEDDDMWVVRTALLHQLRYGADVDLERLFAYVRRHADHTDFFVRKAIGWALRTAYRAHPDAVVAFVEATPLSPLSRREALKHDEG